MIEAKYPEKFKPLFTFGRTGLTRDESQMYDYLSLGFGKTDIDLLTDLIFDKEIAALEYNDKTKGVIFSQIHAVLVLGMLKATQPFYRLLEGLEFFGEDDDYYRSAFLYYIQKVGEAFFDVLVDYFLDRKRDTYNRMLVLEGVKKIVEENKDNSTLLSLWENALVTYLKREDELHDGLNAFALFALVDITEAKHIDLIRKVFNEKPVDLWVDCDLEDLEIRLGLREKRSTPRLRDDFVLQFDEWNRVATEFRAVSKKVGSNDPCPCGSGKKYKKCCLRNQNDPFSLYSNQ